MPDACRVIHAIKSDRVGQPGVGPRGDGLYGPCLSECMFGSPLRHMDHVYCFNFWREFLLFPSALLARLILVFSWCILPLVFGVELAGLLEDPTFSVGMIRGFIGGAMDLTYLVQNFV